MPNISCSCKSRFTIKELYLLMSVPNTLIHSEISKYDSEIQLTVDKLILCVRLHRHVSPLLFHRTNYFAKLRFKNWASDSLLDEEICALKNHWCLSRKVYSARSINKTKGILSSVGNNPCWINSSTDSFNAFTVVGQ